MTLENVLTHSLMLSHLKRDWGCTQLVPFRPADLVKSDKAPLRPTLPAPLSKVTIVKSIFHVFSFFRLQVPPPSLLRQPRLGPRRSWDGEKVKVRKRKNEKSRRRRTGAAVRGAILSCRETRRTLRAAKTRQQRVCTALTLGNLLLISVLWRDRRNQLWRRRREWRARRRRRRLREVEEVVLGGVLRCCEGGRAAPRGLKVQMRSLPMGPRLKSPKR